MGNQRCGPFEAPVDTAPRKVQRTAGHYRDLIKGGIFIVSPDKKLPFMREISPIGSPYCRATKQHTLLLVNGLLHEHSQHPSQRRV